MGITDNPWLAWCVDNAVYALGSWVENNRYEYDEGKKIDHIHELLGVPRPVHKISASAVAQATGGRRIVRVSRAPTQH
jgi:hypothetical protein